MMEILRPSRDTLNLDYMILKEPVNERPGAVRVIMERGDPREYDGDDADRIERRLRHLDPDRPAGEGEDLGDRITVRRVPPTPEEAAGSPSPSRRRRGRRRGESPPDRSAGS